MKKTRIKMCGITKPEIAAYAATLGVDAIGLVFWEKSSRYISIPQAEDIIQSLPAFITVVGLFMNADHDQVKKLSEVLSLDLLQFHGNESSEFCISFNKPYIKAVPMLGQEDVLGYMRSYPEARGFLLDAMEPNESGGSGRTFKWDRIPLSVRDSIILAGGLNANNVAEAIQQTQCYAVDVSSGIESSLGVKDKQKMLAFVEQVDKVYD